MRNPMHSIVRQEYDNDQLAYWVMTGSVAMLGVIVIGMLILMF